MPTVNPDHFRRRLGTREAHPVRVYRVEYPDRLTRAVPTDPVWVTWWARILQPATVVALQILHHLAATHPTDTITAAELGLFLVRTGGDTTYDAGVAADAIAEAASMRLAFLEPDGTIGLITPIPQPGRTAFDHLGRLMDPPPEEVTNAPRPL